MTFIDKLDFWFPFLVFTYGLFLTIALHWPGLPQLAEQRLPHWVQVQMKNHRVLGLVCLCVGSLWSLQNIWFVS